MTGSIHERDTSACEAATVCLFPSAEILTPDSNTKWSLLPRPIIYLGVFASLPGSEAEIHHHHYPREQVVGKSLCYWDENTEWLLSPDCIYRTKKCKLSKYRWNICNLQVSSAEFQKGIATVGKYYDMLTIRCGLRRKPAPEKCHPENIYWCLPHHTCSHGERFITYISQKIGPIIHTWHRESSGDNRCQILHLWDVKKRSKRKW